MYESVIQLRKRLNARLSHLPPTQRRTVVRRIVRDLREVLVPVVSRGFCPFDEPEMTREERVQYQMDFYKRDPDYQNYLRLLNEADSYGSRSCGL